MATVDGLTRARMLAIEANSIVDADINGSGNLILVRHDGTPIDAGHVVGSPGSNGRSIVSAVINGSGHLIITYSDTTQVDVGRVEGVDGEDAAPGSVSVVPDTTPIRTSDGRIKAADPTDNDDVATKLWVANRSLTQALPSGANLNDYKTNGLFYQNTNPSSGLNFPLLRAGLLEVFDRGALGAWQRYTPYASYDDSFYTRSFYSSTWYPWKRYVPEDVWQSYGVQFLATTTNPTMGNSTLVGRYSQRGKTVSVNIDIVFGSTFSVGSGSYYVTLPVTPTNAYHQSLSLLFVSTGDRVGHARIEGSAGNQRLQVHRDNNDATIAMSNLYSTPVSGNRLTIWGTYEAA